MDHNSNEQTYLLACKPFLYIHVDSLKTITGGHTVLYFGVNEKGYLRRSRYEIASDAEMFCSLSQGGLDVLMRSMLATLYVIWTGVTLQDNNGLVEKFLPFMPQIQKRVEGLELK